MAGSDASVTAGRGGGARHLDLSESKGLLNAARLGREASTTVVLSRADEE